MVSKVLFLLTGGQSPRKARLQKSASQVSSPGRSFSYENSPVQPFPGLRCNLQGKGGNFEMLTMARGLCFYLCEYLEAQVKNTGLTTHTHTQKKASIVRGRSCRLWTLWGHDLLSRSEKSQHRAQFLLQRGAQSTDVNLAELGQSLSYGLVMRNRFLFALNRGRRHCFTHHIKINQTRVMKA